MTELPFITPELVAYFVTTLMALIAGSEYLVIRKIGNLSRSYAKMTVGKSRIMADGKIIVTEAGIPEFIQATFDFMGELESALNWIYGLVLNHPSTGWIKGYEPDLIAITSELTEVVAASTPEQPAQPVSEPTGAPA